MINQTFIDRKAGRDCPMCPDSNDADVIAELPSGRVHLQNDADYRGYCILVFRRHAVELHSLSEAERIDWIMDIARIGNAIESECLPAKLNVSMLGNMVPHLHCHIMPRYPEDPEWGRPPAFRPPSERRTLSDDEYQAVRAALETALR